MAGIILDSRKLMVYEDLVELTKLCGMDVEEADSLWTVMLSKEKLYEEFLYFLDNKTLKNEFEFMGYSLTDIFIYIIGNVKLEQDYGKDLNDSGRDRLVLRSFFFMAKLINNPDEYIKKLDAGMGMDRM